MFGEHIPRGDPCDCGMPAIGHRPKHEPRGWPVCECGAKSERHRVKHMYRGQGTVCECGIKKENHYPNQVYRYEYVGIDGEGMGRKPHRYVLLTAADESGKTWTLENPKGIGTEQALYWLLDSLKDCRVFSYGFGYDITCLLRDLPNKALYDLLRPSRRYRQGGKMSPVRWRGFSLDWLQGRLTIKGKVGRVVIWDIIKFYQAPFVRALENWGIDTLNIDAMKQRRGKFRTSELPRIRAYCRDECIQLAKLARKLVETHRKCELTLKSYYGPGSTASIAISKMGAIEYRGETPRAMQPAIACGFFGGRFEHSVMGPEKEVWGYDISSAYPYQLYQLPCLACGSWERVTKKVRSALVGCTTALIRYRYEGRPDDVWAPFPHRANSGSICYPFHATGWLWLPEIQAAIETGFRVKLLEAWVYRTECTHRPFQGIATYYRRRYELGKDTAGIVLKLAQNSCYGKLAQSKGRSPKFQCWPWAGLITSGTRAQLLRLLGRASSRAAVLAIATDGLYSRERLSCPGPIDTGTGDLTKPLGGWEEKHYPDGMLFVKPGIYTTLKPDGEVRARGIGRKSLTSARDALLETWAQGKREFTIKVDRFYGAKTCINAKLRRSPRYGQWAKMPIRISFSCPNRSPTMGLLSTSTPSVPYSPIMMTPEKREALIAEAIEYEQP